VKKNGKEDQNAESKIILKSDGNGKAVKKRMDDNPENADMPDAREIIAS